MKVIGIDPGLSGAIAILEENKVLSLFDMPVMAEGKKKKRQLSLYRIMQMQLISVIKYIDWSQKIYKELINFLYEDRNSIHIQPSFSRVNS